ncbi:hypothetical protein [Pseudostreptobacillus hongkongensis]|uniref:hypothetical protein n=1 Tax=Pseudostreptobacillus hongkongensis TaxID=1162717 RepID=UPI00082BA253|nr:hypothetical protein [Pseudostreptobacillus hongkongensis]
MDNIELLKISTKKEQTEVMRYAQLEEALNTQILLKEEEIKKLKKKSDDNKKNLLQAMENWDITTLKTDKFTITRIPATTRISVDSKKLKEELPEVYEKYSKTSDVKPSLRITLINKGE